MQNQKIGSQKRISNKRGSNGNNQQQKQQQIDSVKKIQQQQTIESDNDTHSILNTPKVGKINNNKQSSPLKARKDDSKEVEQQFLDFLKQQQESQTKDVHHKTQKVNNNKQRKRSNYQQRQDFQRQRTMEQQNLEQQQQKDDNDQQFDYREFMKQQQQAQLKSEQEAEQQKEMSELDQFAQMQKQIVQEMDQQTKKKETFILKAKIKDINNDINLTEEQKRVKIQMLMNKKEKAVRVQHLLKVQQQKIQRNVPTNKEDKFDKNMKIFHGLDTFIETKELIQNMNELNQEQQQKIKEEYTKQKMEKVLGNYKKELAILLEQRPEEEREEFQDQFLDKLELLERAQNALKEKKDLLKKGENVTQQFVEQLQDQLQQEPNSLEDAKSDAQFFFNKLEKDLNSGIFMKDIINETEHQNAGNDNQWQLELLKNQLTKFQDKAPTNTDESQEKLERFQKKAQKVIGLLVKTSKNIFKKKIKTMYEETKTVEYQRQRHREKQQDALKEKIMRQRGQINTDSSIEELDEDSLSKSKSSIQPQDYDLSKTNNKSNTTKQQKNNHNIIKVQNDSLINQDQSDILLENSIIPFQQQQEQYQDIIQNNNNTNTNEQQQVQSDHVFLTLEQNQNKPEEQQQYSQSHNHIVIPQGSSQQKNLFTNITSQLNLSAVKNSKQSRKIQIQFDNSQQQQQQQYQSKDLLSSINNIPSTTKLPYQNNKYKEQKSRYMNDSLPLTTRSSFSQNHTNNNNNNIIQENQQQKHQLLQSENNLNYQNDQINNTNIMNRSNSNQQILKSLGIKRGMNRERMKDIIGKKNISSNDLYQIVQEQKNRQIEQRRQFAKNRQNNSQKNNQSSIQLGYNYNNYNNDQSNIQQQQQNNGDNDNNNNEEVKLPKLNFHHASSIQSNNSPQKSSSRHRYSYLQGPTPKNIMNSNSYMEYGQYGGDNSGYKGRYNKSKQVKKQREAIDELIGKITEEKKQFRSEKQQLYKEIDQLAEKQEKAMDKFKPPKLESLRFIDKMNNHNDMFKANRKINAKSLKMAI